VKEGEVALRIVLDTNIVISGFLWGGTPRRLLQLILQDDSIAVFTSTVLIAELRQSLSYPKLARRVSSLDLDAESLIDHYLAFSNAIPVLPTPGLVPRDPDDDAVAATALAARAHMIVSGDKDLLVLDTIQEIAILTASEAITVVERWATTA
jgi:uncharacterized protein